MLPLDDPRWKELNHGNWSDGKPSSPNAPFVPSELAKLVEHPLDLERFNDLWPWMCSEGTTWAAAYAAIPYTVALAKQVPASQRFDYLYFVGLVVMCSCPEAGESFAIKPYLAESYEQALIEALELIAETLRSPHDVTETRYLLAATAALKGHARLGKVLNDLDS
jgi:hypothetical protein